MRTLSRWLLAVPLIASVLALVPPQQSHASNEFPSTPPPQRNPDVMIQPRRPITDMMKTPVVRVPNVVGQRVADARAMLERAGLRAGRESSQQTTDSTPGTVVRQDPAPGTTVKPSEVVNLSVATAPPRTPKPSDDVGSTSPPRDRGPILDVRPPRDRGPIVVPEFPRFVAVPDLVGRSASEVAARLAESRLRTGDKREEEADAAVGTVVRQAPTAGSRVLMGSPVSVVIATPIMVAVPDLVGRPVSEASERLERTRLAMGPPRREEAAASADTVIRQDPEAGRRVPAGTRVGVVVATPILVTVPDVVGVSATAARARLETDRLQLGRQRREESETAPGTVLSQTPAAGRRVPVDTTVSISVAAPILVTVPDLTTSPASGASALLEQSRLALGDQRREESEAAADTVVRQTPAAGQRVPIGTRVGIVIAAPLLVEVPDVTGQSVTDARRLLEERRLALGRQREETSRTRAGSIVSQSRSAGTRVRPGTAVDVAVAIAPAVVPPAPTTPPNPPPTPPRPPQLTSPSAPAPVPTPTPKAPALVPPVVTPVAVPTGPTIERTRPVVVEPTPTPRGWHPALWIIASMLGVAGAGAAYRYRPWRATAQSTPSAPAAAAAFDFAPHWDAGTFRVGPAGPLCAGHGLTLQSGIEFGVAQLSSEHLVKAVTEEGAPR